MEPTIVIDNNNLEAYGPFKSYDLAVKWADDNLERGGEHASWYAVPLLRPTKWD